MSFFAEYKNAEIYRPKSKENIMNYATQSNTKLADHEKTQLKVWKNEFSEIQVVNLDNQTTMAFQHKGNTVEFALSVMAPTEIKFRRKVGEYYALKRFLNGETVKMQQGDFEYMCEVVWDAYPMTE